MSLSRLSKMCEAIEITNSFKDKIKIIDESLSSFSNPKLVLDILTLNLETNSIGNKRAITWVANALELFEEEVKSQEEIWGDIGEGLYQYLPSKEDSKLSIKEVYSLLLLDCSSINSNSYVIFASAIKDMSDLEIKWFIRYWLRIPRNRVSYSIVVKAINKRFPNNDVIKLLEK